MTTPNVDSPQNDMQIYTEERRLSWEKNASIRNYQSVFSNYYQQHIQTIYRFLISQGLCILELGCGTGEILSALHPARGVGVDFSQTLINQAAEKYPNIEFHCADVHDLSFLKGPFDMILDADLTVSPADLPRFFEAIVSGKGELINGVRMVYPMEKEAMRFLNFLGNKFSSCLTV